MESVATTTKGGERFSKGSISTALLVERRRLTEDVERKGDPCQAEALKEAQGAEHGDVDREGHSQTKHQHEQHRYDQHWVAAKPTG